jgi:nucleoside-diphosphate-sugar epimerase
MSNNLQVIFGTGPLGLSVLSTLLEQGKEVRLVNRSGQRPAGIPESVEIIAGDAYNPDFTRQATGGASVIYQCAQPAYQQWTTEFIHLQSAIMEGAAAAEAKFIVGDNLYMYGKVDGPIHEDLPWSAQTRKGKVRAEAAQQVLEAHRTGKVRASIGRASDFYGPGVLGSTAGERMFAPALKGKAAEGLGDLDTPHTYTYIEDFGRALVTLGERPEALGQVWHVPNAETVSTRRFIEMIFEQLEKPARVKSMGKYMMMLGGLFIPEARESVEMMYEFEKPFVIDNQKYVRAFGNHATPLSVGIQQTIEWYQDQLER